MSFCPSSLLPPKLVPSVTARWWRVEVEGGRVRDGLLSPSNQYSVGRNCSGRLETATSIKTIHLNTDMSGQGSLKHEKYEIL